VMVKKKGRAERRKKGFSVQRTRSTQRGAEKARIVVPARRRAFVGGFSAGIMEICFRDARQRATKSFKKIRASPRCARQVSL
jgi:hypothetical protein